MLPLEFDRQILSSLPLPGEDQLQVVVQVLKGILARRVFPYFKIKRGTDPLLVARVEQRLDIVRLEDETNRIGTVSLVDVGAESRRILIHERIFDYLAFVIPSDPETRLGQGSIEERKVLAFAEFMLRHEAEHLLYPEHRERGVVVADVDFAMDRRVSDPTYYRTLMSALSDEMVGLRGQGYLALFSEAEQKRTLETLVVGMLNLLGVSLSVLPVAIMDAVFSALDVEIKTFGRTQPAHCSVQPCQGKARIPCGADQAALGDGCPTGYPEPGGDAWVRRQGCHHQGLAQG